MRISDVVRKEVHARFEYPENQYVERLLEATAIPFLETPGRERDRVHLAILLRAQGDFDQFARSLATAAIDYRDLLMAAGMGHADWPHVLQAAGFPVP